MKLDGLGALPAGRTTICFPFAGDSIGGSHLSTLGLLRQLNPGKYRILIVPEVPGGNVARLFSEFETISDPGRSGTPVTPGEPFGVRKLIGTLRGLPARVGFLKSEGVHLVHSNDGRTHANWAVAARLAGIPFLWHHRGDPTARGLNLGAPVLADRVLAVSSFALPPAGRWSVAGRAEVLHSPFDTSVTADRTAARAALQAELGFPDEALVLGFFGNLISRKRPLEFVDTVAAVRRQLDRPVTGVMFGEAQEPALATALATRLAEPDVAGAVHLMGFRPEGAYWIAACDQLIVPAVREPFGRTLIEAMLVGTPVIAVASGGNVEALSGGLGVLVQGDDPATLAEAAVALANAPDRAEEMADRASFAARERFGEYRHAARVTEIYEELTARC